MTREELKSELHKNYGDGDLANFAERIFSLYDNAKQPSVLESEDSEELIGLVLDLVFGEFE